MVGLKDVQKMMKDMDKTYDPKVIADDLKRDMDENHEWYEQQKYIEKPEYITKQQNAAEERRLGSKVSDIKLKPLKDNVLIAMEDNRVKSKLIVVTNQTDTNIGFVVNLNDASEYEFKCGDKVVFDLHKIKYRLNYNNIM